MGTDTTKAVPIELDPAAIAKTVGHLGERIRDRFPDAHLARVAVSLQQIAETARAKTIAMGRPKILLRVLIGILIAAIPVGIAVEIWILDLEWHIEAVGDAVAFFQAAVESLIFLGLGVLFLTTIETRIKRKRALAAIHELRVLAHLVDMHQLTKDPVYLTGSGPQTEHSPKRTMTAFELNRYLDYCAEMLALIGKIAALYGQKISDDVARNAIDEVEMLTTGLSRKIWQKVMLLERMTARGSV